MIDCQHCGRQTQNYLCDDCTTQLAGMLDQIPDLIEELDTRIQKLDRIHLGTIGRNRRPDELNVMDFDAAETARKLRKTLLRLVTTIAQRHTGRTPPALSTVTTANLARWLQANTHAIARLNIAGNIYRDINRLVGPDRRSGDLIRAIDRTPERHFAGLCPTIRGHDHEGQPIECEQPLYAELDDRTTTCPECGHTIDVEQNRRRAAESRDLLTTTKIVEVTANIGEPITEEQLDKWIEAKRLRCKKAWLHDGQVVSTRVNEHSQPLYSLKRARKIARRDQQIDTLKTRLKTR